MQPVAQCFPTTGHDPYQGHGGYDLGLQGCFMEKTQ